MIKDENITVFGDCEPYWHWERLRPHGEICQDIRDTQQRMGERTDQFSNVLHAIVSGDKVVPSDPPSLLLSIGTRAKLPLNFDQAAWLDKVDDGDEHTKTERNPNGGVASPCGALSLPEPSPKKKQRLEAIWTRCPDEVVVRILSFIESGYEAALRMVSLQWWRCVSLDRAPGVYRYRPTDLACICAARGYRRLLLWACQQGASLDVECCIQAAFRGDILSLALLREAGCPWDTRACTAAARGGQLETLKWLRKPTGLQRDPSFCPWNAQVSSVIALLGDKKMLEWAIYEGNCPPSKDLSIGAVRYGNFALISFLTHKKQFITTTKEVAAVAMQGANLEILDHLRRIHCSGFDNAEDVWRNLALVPSEKLDTIWKWLATHYSIGTEFIQRLALPGALATGNLVLANRLHNLAPITEPFTFRVRQVFPTASPASQPMRNADSFRWMYNHRYYLSPDVCDQAINLRDIELLKTALEHGRSFGNRELKFAIETNRMDLLNWLLPRMENRDVSYRLYRDAARGHNLPVMKLLVMHEVPWGPPHESLGVMKDLVCTGQLSTAIWAHAHGCNWDYAIVWGSAFEWVESRVTTQKDSVAKALEYLDQLREAGCPLKEATYLFAFSRPELSRVFVEWLLKHNCPWNQETLDLALAQNKFQDHSFAELFDRHFRQQHGENTWPPACIQNIISKPYRFIKNRGIDAIRWLRNHECPWPKDALESAVKDCDFEVMYALYQNQGDRPPLTAGFFAIVVGNLVTTPNREPQTKYWNLLKSLIAAKCPMDETAYRIPLKDRELNLVRWLHDHGCPWTVDTFHRAVESGNPEVVTYLLQQGCPTKKEEEASASAPKTQPDGFHEAANYDDDDDEEMPQVICDTSITTASDWETEDQTTTTTNPDPDAPFEWKPVRICTMR